MSTGYLHRRAREPIEQRAFVMLLGIMLDRTDDDLVRSQLQLDMLSRTASQLVPYLESSPGSSPVETWSMPA